MPTEPSEWIDVRITPSDVELLRRLRTAGLLDVALPDDPTRDPVAWTWEDLEEHMITVQRLSHRGKSGRASTVENRLRYLRFLEAHDVAPVSLHPPDPTEWREHVHHRMTLEGTTGAAMNHYRKALKSLLWFLGTSWPELDHAWKEQRAAWKLPPDLLVPHFWAGRIHNSPSNYRDATLAHMVRWGFYSGIRPPSEFCTMKLHHVDWDEGSVIVTEPKKGMRQRQLVGIEPHVLSSPTTKSLRNYVEHWRPLVARGDTDALWLDQNGNPWNPNVLGQALSRYGKQIWPPFVPYTMRRWCATMRLIASNDIPYVADWLGDTWQTVQRAYVDHARVRAARDGQYHLQRFQLGTPEGRSSAVG